MKKIDGAVVALIEVGVVLFLLGALSQSSLFGQIGSLTGHVDQTYKDLKELGLLTIVSSIVINFLPDPPRDSNSPSILGDANFDPKLTVSVNTCATLLVVFFFLPWAQVLGASVSGYELAKLGSAGLLAVLIPITAIMLILNNALGFRNKYFVTLVGTLPIFALLIGLGKTDGKVLNFLGFGAYLIFLTSAALLLVVYEVIAIPSKR